MHVGACGVCQLELLSLIPYVLLYVGGQRSEVQVHVLIHACEQHSVMQYVLVRAGGLHGELHACMVNIDLNCFHYFPTFWCMQVSTILICLHAL